MALPLPLPLSKLVNLVLAGIFIVVVAWKSTFPGDDPYRCRAVMNTGRWLDPPDSYGSRFPFTQWQPDGCILHQYTGEEIRQCFEGRRAIFGGDSTSRGLTYGMGRLLEKDEADYERDRNPKDKIFHLKYHGVTLTRYPNVWLHSTGYEDTQSEFIQELKTYSEEKRNPLSIEDQKSAAIVYLAGGVWYTNPSDAMGHDGRMERYHRTIANLSEIVGHHDNPIFTSPMDPIDGVGNQIFYAPPGGPGYLGTDPGRIEDTDRRVVEVKEMQDWLHETEGQWNIPPVWAITGVVEGQNRTWVDPLITGFHVIDGVAETRANILLNMRCNAKLDRMKSYPYNRTCCTDYGIKPFVQVALVYLGMLYLIACVACELLDIRAGREKPLFRLLNMQAGVFVMALLMCYYADRTHMMAKGSKFWSIESFYLLCVPSVMLGIATLRKSTPPPASKESALVVEFNQPFLSRDQTDEWKGWMQFIILIYHWVGSRSTSIYILVRLLVAAYLFQTGYGHTLFFLTKKDFSFNRAAGVLLRLNLLSCSLAFFMNTDYMFYYFSPLVSFWFLVVYATMAIGKGYNGDVQFVLAKILISCLAVSFVVFATPFTDWLFKLLHLVFKIQWSYTEWNYRVSLDIFIVYVGMLVALAFHELQTSINMILRMTLAFSGLLACYGYFHATASQGMTEYKFWHPYVSFVPVLAFIAIRNVSANVRNYHSKAMAWLGRCSLETYTLQFHLLLAADTKGVLLIDGFFGDGTLHDRWRSLIIIVPVFLWISSVTATATGYFVKLIIGAASDGSIFNNIVQRVPGASSYFTVPKARIAAILVVIWLLNLMSPDRPNAPVPDGPTPTNGIDHIHDNSTAVPSSV